MKTGLVAAAVAALALVPASPGSTQAEPTLKLKSTRYGRVLFDGRNQVVYAFTRDRRGGPSRCYGACAKAWPVYYAKGLFRAGTGVRRSLIGTTKRHDGRRQITYNGWPLYYYAHEGPNQVLCQNVDEFGGLWLVVRGDGKLVR